MSFEFSQKNNEASKNALEIFGAPEESEQFPGSKIFTVKEGDKFVRFALNRDSAGQLQGSEFELQEYKIVNGGGGEGFWDNSASRVDADGFFEINGKNQEKYRIGAVYQMHSDKLSEFEALLKEKGIEV